jgi:hypothetical protein
MSFPAGTWLRRTGRVLGTVSVMGGFPVSGSVATLLTVRREMPIFCIYSVVKLFLRSSVERLLNSGGKLR